MLRNAVQQMSQSEVLFTALPESRLEKAQAGLQGISIDVGEDRLIQGCQAGVPGRCAVERLVNLTAVLPQCIMQLSFYDSE